MGTIADTAEHFRRQLAYVRRATYWQEARRRLGSLHPMNSAINELDTKFETAKAALVNVHGQLVDTITQVEANVPNSAIKTALLVRLNKMRTDLLAAREAAS
jgi:hypothetical protein